MKDKEETILTNRGFIVDLIFNFPQGSDVDKEAYVNQLFDIVKFAIVAGNFGCFSLEEFLKLPANPSQVEFHKNYIFKTENAKS